MELSFFHKRNILEASRQFFSEILDINVAPAVNTEIKIQEFLKGQITDIKLLSKVTDARIIGMVNNISINDATAVADTDSVLKDPSDDYDMLIVFGIEIDKNVRLTKTDISRFTRALNRRSFSRPVVVLIRYGNLLSFSAAERGRYKNPGQSGEKVGRISILKDIDIDHVHTGHERILLQLRINPLKVTSFKDIYDQWLEVFNISLLNKEFYNELFTWYLWAVRSVSFPNNANDVKDVTVYNSENVIRLLTRLIFCWFVKEKGLIPESLFDKNELTKHIKDFKPETEDNSDYYKAILQNLFFATLNTEMPKDGGKRVFLDENKKNANSGYTEEYLDHLVYRYKDKFINPNSALELFDNIPFLNGGLFECLDTKDFETNKEIRIDGFSSKLKNQPTIPNVLFFGHNDDLDLSSEFEDGKKYKHCKAKGIIGILNSYKFTIEENTPLEQEIALDPELLGKIFENLLASYNPETKTTARKQTGSYYTPREIVNYMVDESLIACIKTKLTDQNTVFWELGTSQTNMFGNEIQKSQLSIYVEHAANKWIRNEDELELKLHQLFTYDTEDNPFDKDDVTTNAIIAHLSECKILDPACGSGAFPMGILHKMVLALSKLDPCNKTWKLAQLEKAKRDMERAEKFEDETLREAAVKNAKEKIDYIEESFGETGHELDYTRKLFLIENCIFGVDIQQIAVQISKLRFFISLMVDQRVDDKKQNRNILSLPNLETKFVAANTLIPVDKPQQLLLKDPDLLNTEKELHEIHHKIFFTRNYSDKKRLKIEELKTRKLLRLLYVEKAGYSQQAAEEITKWNPFDPLKAAPFFDPEVMFTVEKNNLKGYFDIVIGNPPYVRVDDIDKSLKNTYSQLYNTSSGKYDMYYLFYEKGIALGGKSCNLIFITPNKFCAATSATNLRNLILSEEKSCNIVGTTKLKVFDASNYPLIVHIHNPETFKIYFREALSLSNLKLSTNNHYYINSVHINHLPKKIIPINSNLSKVSLLIKLFKKGTALSTYLSISEGLRIKTTFETNNSNDLPIVKQYQFEKWANIKTGEYIKKDDFVTICSKNSDRFKKIYQNKILFAEDALQITATLDENKMIPQGGVYFGTGQKELSLKYLLSLINSKLLSFFYEVLFAGMHMGGGYLRYRTHFLELLPIVEHYDASLFEGKSDNILLDHENSTLINQLDLMVYKLYNLAYAECQIIDPDLEGIISKEVYEQATIDELAKFKF